ncbi:MAG: threonine--tRNA ligase, partial [Mycobacteriales bacterium]
MSVRVDASQAGSTAGSLLPKDSAVARVNGELRDLAHVVAEGDVVEQVPYGSEDGRAVLRHSAAHVLAQAVQELFPGTLLGIGPPVKDGFYYDFAPHRPFTPEDLVAIEKKMSDIVRQRQRFSRRVVTEEDARVELSAERFKLELIGLKGGGAEESVEVGGAELTIYDNLVGDTVVWRDLCRGPHLPTTRDIPAFALMRSAAAYWRGDQANPQLQRIYGTAWE